MDKDEFYEEFFIEEEEEEEEEYEETPNSRNQQSAMADTFGYDSPEESGEEEESESEEGGESDEEPSGEEEESGEGEEGVSDELDDILGKHEQPEVTSDEEEEEEDDETEGDEEEEEDTEEPEGDEYEPMSLDLDEEEFEEITSSPEQFSNFMKDVREDALEQARQEFTEELDKRASEIEEEVLRNIPEVVNKSQTRAQRVNSAKDQFFNDYPQLENKMGYVQNMTAVVSNEHPDWGAEKVLNEVGRRAERDLEISKRAKKREQERQNSDNDDPKFAGAGGRTQPSSGGDNRNKQQKIMDETFG